MPKNIIFFMADQLRNDYVGYSGSGKGDTPNIDRIARGCSFSHCTTVNPICMPARTSLITGRYSRQIGSLTMSGAFDPQIPTFMQALRGAGYKTYGIGKYHYMHLAGVSTPRGKGYDHVAMHEEMKKLGYDFVWESAGKQTMVANYCDYGKYLEEKGLLKEYRDFVQTSGGINGDTADHNYDKANAWPFAEEDYIDIVTGRIAAEQIRQLPKDQPFYMYISFCGPHKTYDAPQRYLDMYPYEEDDNFNLSDGQSLTEEEKKTIYRQRRSYRAMIKCIDDQIGMLMDLLEQRGLLEDSLVIFTSDHGDMLGDHYLIQKGCPWNEAVNVPLCMSASHLSPVGTIGSPVQLIDIAATILEFAGLEPQQALSKKFPAYNDRIPCRSLLPILNGSAKSVRDFSYCESDFTEEVHPGTDMNEVFRKRGGSGIRSNGWRMVTDGNFKYIKYVDYDAPGMAHEELYDVSRDPLEQVDLAKDPSYAARLTEGRNRADFIVDHYPPCQRTWDTVLDTRGI